MRKPRMTAAVSLTAAALAGPALADGVTAVTLSSGGLAEIVSRHAVTGNGQVRITVPAEQLDDILKSLVVRDPAGRIGGLRLDGPAQAEETLRRLPFKAEDIASPARLANALQGIPIRVESDGKTVEGASLGVSERNGGRDEGVVRTLSVMTKDGQVDSVRLVEGASLTILDPAMAQNLRAAAAALGAAKVSGARGVEIALEGQGARDVDVSYVVPAPVWKTAYRVVSGKGEKARVQAWAIVENATGADWKDVSVTLQSGAPVTLRQRLFQRYWRERPEVPIDVEAARVPQVDTGEMERRSAAMPAPATPPGGADTRRYRAAGAARPTVAAMEQAPADMAAPAASAEATESAVAASFRLPSPVTLGAGGTLSIPIVDAEMPSERVSLWRPGDGLHPVAAITVRNAAQTTLPPGILTVYDEQAGYVGDARLPATPPGEERLASFATDRKVQIRAELKPEERVAGIKVTDGVARVSVVSRRMTTYSVKGAPDGERTVVIEQPRLAGWSFASPAASGETATAHRLKVKLAAGESKQAVATQEFTRLDSFQLADADETQLLQWAAAPADARTSDKLKSIARIRTSVAAAEREIEAADDKLERLKGEQERIRANMGSAPRESAFGKRLLAQLEASETQIAQAGDARDKASQRRDGLQAQIRTAIAEF